MNDPPVINWEYNRYESDLQQPGEEVDIDLGPHAASYFLAVSTLLPKNEKLKANF